MNFSASRSSKCSSFRLQLLVMTLLLTVSVNTSRDDGSKKLGGHNFEHHLPSCIRDKIDLRKFFPRVIKENGACVDDLSTDFRAIESSSNSSSDGISSHYCSIELVSVVKNASASHYEVCQKPTIKLTLCVPATCNENEFEEDVLKSVLQSDEDCIRVKTNSSVCYTIREGPSVSLYLYVSIFLLTFVVVNIICTVYDLLKNFKTKDDSRASTVVKLTKDFSIVRNYRKLTDTSLSNEKPCIHLISICTIILIIVGQQRIFSTISSSGFHAYRMSSSRCVDVLFVVSGFLTFHYGFKPMQKGRGLFLVISVVFRWLRMMPTYCVLILFVMYVLPNLGDGITWKYRMQSEASVCESQFWKNIFCVMDYSDSNKECFSVSWFIRLDLQLSAVGSILLLILTLETRAGLVMLPLIVVCTYVYAFAAIHSSPFVGEAIRFQSSMYSRIPPYFIGFVIGGILRSLKKRNCEFSNVQKWSFLIVAYGLKISIVLCDWLIPIHRTSQWSAFAVVTYAASSRWIYVLFETLMILIYYTCGLGRLNEIIQLKILIPIGRLSYVALLASSLIHLFHSGDSESMSKLCSHSIPTLVTWTLIDIFSTYVIGFLLHLFFEAPFSRISKRILQHLLWVFAKPMEEVCTISSKGESDEHIEKSIDGKRDKNEHENKAFENDEQIVRQL